MASATSKNASAKAPEGAGAPASAANLEAGPGMLRYEPRAWYWRVPFVPSKPKPPKAQTIEDAALIPDVKANFLSRWTLQWINPLVNIGYTRPLVAEDLYKLDEARAPKAYAEKLRAAYIVHAERTAEYNAKLAAGEIKPSAWTRLTKLRNDPNGEKLRAWREKKKKKTNMLHVVYDVVRFRFWISLVLKFFGDMSLILSPLLIQAMIKYIQTCYTNHRNGEPVPHIAKGIGYALGLFFMQLSGAVAIQNFWYTTFTSGILLRAGFISAIYARSMNLTHRSRAQLPNGRLMTLISSDVTRVQTMVEQGMLVFTSPLQIIVCLVLLIIIMGPAGLAGFVIFVIAYPPFRAILGSLKTFRVKAVRWTERRVALISEVLGSMQLVKFFTFEIPFVQRISEARRKEITYIRQLIIVRSAANALAFCMPALGTVVAVVVYVATKHTVNPSAIFSGVALFQLLRVPLLLLPGGFAALVDGKQALIRLEAVFSADTVTHVKDIQEDLDLALIAEDATFTWDANAPAAAASNALKSTNEKEKDTTTANGTQQNRSAVAVDGSNTVTASGTAASSGSGIQEKKKNASDDVPVSSSASAAVDGDGDGDGDDDEKRALEKESRQSQQQQPETPAAQQKPQAQEAAAAPKTETAANAFQVRNVTMRIPRGQLVAIVGPVGSGKSSLLQGLVGEMKRVKGEVVFGGSVGYCAQTSWIQNATIRQNITFGAPFDEEKYWTAVRASCLQPDLDILPAGDMTQVGEKGIQLSGGQKQRVSVCRALYSAQDITLFDDPLSALDSHVGTAVFKNVIRNGLAGKTRILVTHALHFLPHVDYIYTMVDGRIAEQGTYEDLSTREGGAFAKLVRDLAPKEEKGEGAGVGAGEGQGDDKRAQEATKKAVKEAELMRAEERSVGSVSGDVYKGYFIAGRGPVLIVPLVCLLVALQGANTMTSYWIVYWNENEFHKPQGFYMGILAGWGVSQALLSFAFSATFSVLVYLASANLHKSAISRIMHAPMSYFDTTPLGRIINRFSKDIDTIDNLLGPSITMFVTIFAQLLAGIILVGIVLPYFFIPGGICLLLFFWGRMWYTPSAREIKRIDALLRSHLYSGLSESLAGLTTIRAYEQIDRFLVEVDRRIDVENRALWAYEAAQRWLGARLDVIGTTLSFSVALILVSERVTISPAKAGLALSYLLSIQQVIGVMVRQSVDVQSHLNSVERIMYYAKEADQEAPHFIADKKPAPQWPQEGRIRFEDVVLTYRADLGPTLKGLTASVKAGEKIGIVGRTGAGKSSIMVALYRIVELSGGRIVIDDIDVGTIGLNDLRSKIAIIPQEPLLFSGTLRSNLDPFGNHDDATLWDAVKRSHLLSSGDDDEDALKAKEGATKDAEKSHRLSLDSTIDADGANLSVGQRSLVSLARALVKNSKILVLDEATASVDYLTDRKIQDTIATEFADRTILCIAHRLQTIIGYDRIIVMDSGKIAQFGTPLELFRDTEGIFHSMCTKSSIVEDDIRLANKKREDDSNY